MSSPTAEGPLVATARDANPEFWRKIERFLKARTLVPVLGPGIITFGEDDRLLYPWVTEQVAMRLGLESVPPSMHALVCAHLRKNGRVEDVCIEIDDLLDSSALEPGPLLRALASVSQCRLFFTLGFDPLMERALNLLRGNGRPVTKSWRFSLDSVATDLPNPVVAGAVLGYLFGKASPNPGYLLWDADAIEFVWQLQRQLPALNALGQTLSENNLLIMGASYPDWLVRFLLRAIRQRPFTEGSGRDFLLAESEPPSQADAVVFYESLRRNIQVFPGDPIAVTREFCRRAHAQEPPLTAGIAPGTNLTLPLMEPEMSDGSIFISYSHAPADAAGAFRIVEKLRAAGCVVWLDEERLTCGDDFENHLEDAVRRHCGFFVSVISRATEGRSESYYHKERKWAAQRFDSMTHARPFYFPVTIDDTPLPPRQEPRAFAAIDVERAPGGEISDQLTGRLAALQQRLMNLPAPTGASKK
jgi:TIR domain/SIR2-like domain